MINKPLTNLLELFRFLHIKKHLPSLTNKKVLDLGCGVNFYTLSKLSPSLSSGTGIDILQPVGNTPANLTFIQSDLDSHQKIPVPDSSFDLAISLAVVEHLNNPHFLVSEAYRCLNPGGLLIITTPTPISKPILELLSFRLNLIDRQHILEHKHYFNRSELSSLLTSSGFKIQTYSLFEFGFNQIIIGKK